MNRNPFLKFQRLVDTDRDLIFHARVIAHGFRFKLLLRMFYFINQRQRIIEAQIVLGGVAIGRDI